MPTRVHVTIEKFRGQLWGLVVGGHIFSSDSSEQWSSGQRYQGDNSQMIVLSRKGFGLEDWSVVLGFWFTCRMNLGQPDVHQTLLGTGFVDPSSPRSHCQDAFRCATMPVKDAGNDPEKGRKPSLGCRSDTSDGEKEERQIRAQCRSKTASGRSLESLKPRFPTGVPLLIGTGWCSSSCHSLSVDENSAGGVKGCRGPRASAIRK